MDRKKHSFLKRNGLSTVLLTLMALTLIGQFKTVLFKIANKPAEERLPETCLTQYLQSGHLIQATFEKRQSEFRAVAAIVILNIWLRQKGVPESKPVDAPHLQTGG